METVCGLLSPPRTPSLLTPPSKSESTHRRRTRHTSEMSNPEMALYIEKEHLRNAEESDYHLMQDLIDNRFSSGDNPELDERFDNNAFFLTVTDEVSDYKRYNLFTKILISSFLSSKLLLNVFSPSQSRSLRRSSAIEMKDFSNAPIENCPSDPQFQVKVSTSVDSMEGGRKESHSSIRGNSREDTSIRDIERVSVHGPMPEDSASEVFENEDIVQVKYCNEKFSERAEVKDEQYECSNIPTHFMELGESSGAQEQMTKTTTLGRNTFETEGSRRYSQGSDGSANDYQLPQEHTRSTSARKLSRQESQGKVGRQNTLAMDIAGMAHGSKKISSQPSLPPQKEEEAPPLGKDEKGSRDSLMMPSETMC